MTVVGSKGLALSGGQKQRVVSSGIAASKSFTDVLCLGFGASRVFKTSHRTVRRRL